MGISLSLPSFPVEILFAIVSIFLFFAPIILEWDWTSYIGCLFFAGLTLAVIKLRKE
jgi:hypothetical protein